MFVYWFKQGIKLCFGHGRSRVNVWVQKLVPKILYSHGIWCLFSWQGCYLYVYLRDMVTILTKIDQFSSYLFIFFILFFNGLSTDSYDKPRIKQIELCFKNWYSSGLFVQSLKKKKPTFYVFTSPNKKKIVKNRFDLNRFLN